MIKKKFLTLFMSVIIALTGVVPTVTTVAPITTMAATITIKEPCDLKAENCEYYTSNWKKKDGIFLTWATSYEKGDTFNIFYKENGKWKLLKSGVKTIDGMYGYYTDKTVATNTKRTYTVQRVHKENGKTYKSAYGKNTVTALQLQAPTLNSREDKKDNIYLTWKKLPKADKYIVYRRIQKGKYTKNGVTITDSGKWKAIKTTTSLEYKIGKVKPASAKEYVSYQYVLSCVRGNAESAYSNCLSWQDKIQ